MSSRHNRIPRIPQAHTTATNDAQVCNTMPATRRASPLQWVAAWLRLYGLRSRHESLCSAYNAEREELDSLEKQKRGALWLSTPTLDERIRAGRKQCAKLQAAMAAISEQMALQKRG